MPFDPTLPLNDSELKSAEMRSQFTGLKDLIDAIPAPRPEADPFFAASEAARFVAGDKAKLDAALPPNGNGGGLTGLTAAQVGALAPDGDGSELAGLGAAQITDAPWVKPLDFAAVIPGAHGVQQICGIDETGSLVGGVLSRVDNGLLVRAQPGGWMAKSLQEVSDDHGLLLKTGDGSGLTGLTAAQVGAATAADIAAALTALLSALPASDPAVAGAVWNDHGVLRVSAG